jgi:hypothetical protein
MLRHIIRNGEAHAARVVQEDQHIEGSFWLCKVRELRTVQVGGDLHCGQHFLGGTKVAEISLLLSGSTRC